MPATDTKTTILDAAEALFADQGFAATSLRQLTTAAGVNLAAVNYHFGSKEELAKAVLRRRIEPINAERHRRLDQLSRPATLEQIIRAFVEPVLRSDAIFPDEPQGKTPTELCRLFGRISVERPPFLRGFLHEQFGDLARRLVAVFGEAAPSLDPSTIWWRLHFMVGSLAHTLQNAHLIGPMSNGQCESGDTGTIVEQLVAFCAAGFASEKSR